MWKNEKFSLTERKFRQINYLSSNFFSKTVAFTKFLPIKCVREFLQFPHCECGRTRSSLQCKFLSSNQFRIKCFSKKLLSRNFCEKMEVVKFRNFHSVQTTERYVCFLILIISYVKSNVDFRFSNSNDSNNELQVEFPANTVTALYKYATW